MPLELLNAVFVYAWLAALENPLIASELITCVILARVGFLGLLRPVEIARLVREDVRLPTLASQSSVALLALRGPKNRRYMGRAQFSVLRDPAAVAWLAWLCEGLPPGAPLWPHTQAHFSKVFKGLLYRMGLQSLGLTAGSLRPGGTTSLFLEGFPVDYIKYLGRWKSEQSLAVYVQEAMAHLVWLRMSDDDNLFVQALIAAHPQVLRAPPQHTPWSQVFQRPRRSQWPLANVAPLRSVRKPRRSSLSRVTASSVASRSVTFALTRQL